MAHYKQLISGIWQAQVFKRGVRRSSCFPSEAEAKKWGDKTEREILSNALGMYEPIKLAPAEFTRIYVKAKERAKLCGMPFEIKRDDVVMIFGRSGGNCEVTGIRFNRFKPANNGTRPWFPSLDRIDSSKGYAVDNCRMVCVAVNIAMGQWGEWVLNAMANAICYGKPGILINGPMADPQETESLE